MLSCLLVEQLTAIILLVDAASNLVPIIKRNMLIEADNQIKPRRAPEHYSASRQLWHLHAEES